MAKQRIFEPRISRRTTNSTGNENLRRNRATPPCQRRGSAMVPGSASAPGRTTPRPRGVTQKKCGRRPVESSTCRARGAPDGTRGLARSPGPGATAPLVRSRNASVFCHETGRRNSPAKPLPIRENSFYSWLKNGVAMLSNQTIFIASGMTCSCSEKIFWLRDLLIDKTEFLAMRYPHNIPPPSCVIFS